MESGNKLVKPLQSAAVSFFFPRVAVIIIAVLLPEAGMVFGGKLDAGYPLGALPEIEPRDDKPYRAAVRIFNRLVVVVHGE